MNTLMITRCSNGYILTLCNELTNAIDSAIASKNNPRGYGEENLITAIEDIFERNTPKPVDLFANNEVKVVKLDTVVALSDEDSDN